MSNNSCTMTEATSHTSMQSMKTFSKVTFFSVKREMKQKSDFSSENLNILVVQHIHFLKGFLGLLQCFVEHHSVIYGG